MSNDFSKGIRPIVEQITKDLKRIINDFEETQKKNEPLENIKKKLYGNLDLLKNLGVKVEKTAVLIQSVISSISHSRNELKKSVDGLLHKTGAQLGKITSTTEEATNKILDVAEKLDEDQMEIIDKVDALEKDFNIPSESIEEIRSMLQSNQDKAFTIMDYLQFQDITAQQIAGAYALLSDTEKTLIYVSELLREFDDVSKEEEIKIKTKQLDNSFNADAKFEDKTKLQDSIDNMFNTGKTDIEFPEEEGATETKIQSGAKPVESNSSGSAVEQDDIDSLFANQKQDKVAQDDIDSLFSSSKKDKPENQKQIMQDDIDNLFKKK